NHHHRQKLEARQIPHFSFVYVVNLADLPPATGTRQFPVATLAPHPQREVLLLLIDGVPVNLVSRPSQYRSELSISLHPPSLTEQHAISGELDQFPCCEQSGIPAINL